MYFSVSRFEIGRYYYGKRQSSGMKARCEVLVFPMEIESAAERWPENLPQVKRDYEQRAGELERSADVLRAMLAGHRE